MPLFDSMILSLVWTFNLAALLLMSRADLLQRVVLGSRDLIVLLVAADLAWSVWLLWTGQPWLVCFSACWLGFNLLVTVGLARRHAADLQPGQVVLLCAWWIGLLGMVVQAFHASGFILRV